MHPSTVGHFKGPSLQIFMSLLLFHPTETSLWRVDGFAKSLHVNQWLLSAGAFPLGPGQMQGKLKAVEDDSLCGSVVHSVSTG